MLTRKRIEQLITACDCTPRIKEVAALSKDAHWHVQVYKKGYRGRSLGKLSVVAQLSEEALRNRVITKFVHAPQIFGAFFEERKSMNDFDNMIKVTPFVEEGTYNVWSAYSKDVLSFTAQGLLSLAQWVEQNKAKLEAESTCEQTIGWHATMTAMFALEDGRVLYGTERLELLHEGQWLHGKTGHLGPGTLPVFFPDGAKDLHKEYIALTAGKSVVRKVSQPYGDAKGFPG
jgi:hypothetical protein